MIKKIIKIKNIGKYELNSSDDDESFGVKTIVFGANKIGKTTLVSILRSLKEANTSYITSRKTFGASADDKQECVILFECGTKSIFDSSWSNANIEIFDNDFVHGNVFVGDKIGQDHKTKLHRILIDESNLELQKKIDSEEDKYRDLVKNKEKTRTAVGENFNEFIKLTDKDEITDITIKIKDNQNKQKQYYNQSKLSHLKSLTQLAFDFTIFETNIKQDIDTSLELDIKEHIRTCWDDEKEDFDFLSLGIDKLSDSKNLCPFCGQDLNGVFSFISGMKSFFSEAYKKTQSSIEESINDFKEIDIAKVRAQFKAEGFEFAIPIDENVLGNDLKMILKKLDKKQKDLSLDVKIEKLPEYIHYKEVVVGMNAEVESLKIESIDINVLQKEELHLKLNEERFSVGGKEKYRQYKEATKAVFDKKKEIDHLNQGLIEKLNNLFEEYLDDINMILKDSFANFKLAELKSISNRTLKESFFCDYAFIFDNKYSVSILDEEHKPQFKNTLSDSDKRIFAFAFFIAKLKRDNLLPNKIVVLDDPFTSLDEERRDPMIDILNNLECEQLVILSHSRTFVKRCLLRFNKNNDENEEKAKALRLKNNSSNKTEIAKLDVREDNDFLEGVELYLKVLSEADTGSITSDYDNVRKIIEHIVKAKYGHLLSPDEKRLPMKYFNNPDCKSMMKKKIGENDYQENHHDMENLPNPEELLYKRQNFISEVLPCI